MTKTRLLAALIMAPVAILTVLLASTPVLAAVSALLFLAALWEWLKLADVDDTLARSILLLCNIGLMAALVWGSRSAQGGSLALLQLVALMGVGWWVLSLAWLRHYDFASDHDTHARVFKLAAGTLAVIPAWAALCLIHASEPNGHRWLLLALVLVWAADTGAYFTGRRFGKRKLAPRISPNKTVEGLAGGVLLAVLVALVGAPLAGATLEQMPAVALVAVATILASVTGDLFESLLKRHIGVKDSGDLIPGHGGVLDRMDSVLAALPVFALGKAWFGF